MKRWEDLGPEEQMHKMLQARFDPIVFCEDPYFLGCEIWPLEKDIIRRFVWGVPKEMPIDEWIGLRETALKNNTMAEFTKAHVQQYNDLIIEAGMNSGKTFLTSCIGLQQAFELLSLDDPVRYYGVGPGTEFFVLNVATSDDQAHDTIYAQEKGKIENSPYFQWLHPQEKYNEFSFPLKHVTIKCGGSNSASLVGRAVKAALFDELGRFQDTKGGRSGWAVFHGLGRGTKKVPALKSRRIAISSTLYSGDIIDQLYEQSKRIPTMLGFKYATWEMNPNITEASLADDFAQDPDAAWRDYGAQPSRAIEKYYTDVSIIKFDICDREGNVHKRPNPVLVNGEIADWLVGSKSFDYILTGDPAVKYESFGLALGHLNADGRICIDLLHKIAPKLEVDPTEVKYFVGTLRQRFGITKFIVDRWDYPETVKEIRDSGIEVAFNIVKLQQHERLKEAWRLNEIDCYEHEGLKSELTNLEIHRGQKIEHPRKGAKDLADALAQLVWELKGKPVEPLPFNPTYYRKIIANQAVVRVG